MSLPPCVMCDAKPFPDGSTQHYCRHPQYPYRLRLLALHPDHCHTCPLRQETGSPPPPPAPPQTPDPAAYTPGRPRPDLQAIELTLPPHQEGRDRKVRFEPDGSIVYEKGEGEWEPPRPINGYLRDPATLGDFCHCGSPARYGTLRPCGWSTAAAWKSSCAVTTPPAICSRTG